MKEVAVLLSDRIAIASMDVCGEMQSCMSFIESIHVPRSRTYLVQSEAAVATRFCIEEESEITAGRP